jgi:hypothetical protein
MPFEPWLEKDQSAEKQLAILPELLHVGSGIAITQSDPSL